MSDGLLIVVTLLLSAFFSGMEIAFISANKLKIEVDKNNGLFSAKIVSRFIKTPSKFIGAMLVGNNIALVIYGIIMARILEPAISNILPQSFHSSIVILIIQTVIATLLILITSEFLPKVIFRINANFILNLLAIPATICYYFLYPIVFVFVGVSEYILKHWFKVKFLHQDIPFTLIDVDNYIDEFTRDNLELSEIKQELQMFQNAIDFKSVKIRECMIPRNEIVAIDINDTIAELKDKFIETSLSRILIYEGTIDNITGFVHSHDILKNPDKINKVIKPIIYVPETLLANNLLTMFTEKRMSVAVVVDEFGGTSGMITTEDVIEEIIGEINDEYDVDELTEKKIADDEYIFAGRLEIDYLNDKYQLNLPESEDYETLAGLIIHYKESIPDLDDEIITDNFIFKILEASETKIEKVNLKIKNK
ncbi:MAG: hemolysin family protein [Bacteroidota bacterium]